MHIGLLDPDWSPDAPAVLEGRPVEHGRRTNRIHEVDLARAILALLSSPAPPALLHATDGAPALLGEVGCGTRCTVYENRSSTCREFTAAWENGEANPHCDAARAAYGLPPLTPPLQPHLSPDRVA